MKKIGIILDSTPGGGVFQYVHAVLDAVLRFPQDKFEVCAAYTDSSWLGLLPLERVKTVKLNDDSLRSRILNRVWHETRLSNASFRRVSPFIDPTIASLVAEKCDMWICPANDRWAFRAPIPALGAIHDLMHIHEPGFPETGSPEELRERDHHFEETCRWSKGVMVDSAIGKVHVCDAYDIAPEKVFELPYIAPRYIYDSAERGRKEIAYDLPAKYFFYPATFWLHKNHKGLFAAIDRLRVRHPDIRLVLVGAKQNGYDAAKAEVTALGIDDHVQFLGYVPEDDMFELYSRARALVMPSFFGPTNIPQLEAFVAGCPVAVSRVYGVPDQVGDASLLFDPSSVDQIAEAMERLWTEDELCEHLASRGRAHAREWGPVQFSGRLQDIVETLISRGA